MKADSHARIPARLRSIILACLIACLPVVAHAAISIDPGGSVLLTFETNPPPTQWSTLSVAGSSTDILSASAMDVAVQLLSVSSITAALTSTATVPPSENALARWNSSGRCLQTRPAGNAFLVLMATLQNNTGRDLNSVVVSYDLGRGPLSSFGPEPVPGHRVYYSYTGAPGGWTLIPELSTDLPGALGARLSLVAWQAGSYLYLLWADDNATSETDLAYMIDNFSVSLPSPSGAISVGASGSGTLTFDTYPHATNGWSTLGVPGMAGDITNAAGLDAQVQLLDAASVTNLLWFEYTYPPDDGGNAIAGWNGSTFTLQTRPVANRCIVLMATLQNETGSNVSALNVAYDFQSVITTNASEHIPGYRAYYSRTGTPGDWHLIPELCTDSSRRLTAVLDLDRWPPKNALYLLWADDNGPSGTGPGPGPREGVYAIDNFAVQPVVSMPRLAIRSSGTNTLLLSWPSPSTGFLLQQNRDLTTTNWLPADLDVVDDGTNKTVIVFPSPSNNFFRLKRP